MVGIKKFARSARESVPRLQKSRAVLVTTKFELLQFPGLFAHTPHRMGHAGRLRRLQSVSTAWDGLVMNCSHLCLCDKLKANV